MKRPPCVSHGPRYLHYKLTCDEFDLLVQRSEGRCERCEKPYRNLIIDHDHSLGGWAVRGLVCYSCNGQPGMWAVEKQGPLGIVFREERMYFAKAFHRTLDRYRPEAA